jgi:nitrogenase-associated protein
MAHVIFFEKPGCGGNARQKKALSESGHSLDVRDLLTHPWTSVELASFMTGLPTSQWFNRASPRVKSGEIVPELISADKAMALLLADPLLIRRPLMQVDGTRMVGWDEAKVAAWIGLSGSGIGEGCPKHDHHPGVCPAPASTAPGQSA